VDSQGRINNVMLASEKPKRVRKAPRGSCAVCGGPTATKYCGLPCYRVVQRSVDLAARFWSKVQRGAPQACWPWAGSLTENGYGQFIVKNWPTGAHRVSWELSHGPVPADKHVLHRCDNPPCVNPAHLFIGTRFDNMQDAASKGRFPRTRPWLHKVTDEQIEEMVRLRQSGLNLVQIADRFNVSKSLVSLAVRGLRRQYREMPAQRRSA
jgi:hypothetical protein